MSLFISRRGAEARRREGICSRKDRKERKEVVCAAGYLKPIGVAFAATFGLESGYAANPTSLRSLRPLRESRFSSFLRASAPPREPIYSYEAAA
jgi:hypothetical protein